jgi:hypothetical protein
LQRLLRPHQLVAHLFAREVRESPVRHAMRPDLHARGDQRANLGPDEIRAAHSAFVAHDPVTRIRADERRN